ncbi:ABC transporter permease [Nocardiopsis composta]|uniref:Transport permease protein n=1 Tax=Nocardiopsis composta TaxID=157465 RepID=A0A7W8QNQ9_9ACTN|nr:ABC transporter permease [Nocardiopsis composta]MBB5433349.1 ABC-2 type transport system permease protein [Nocardiopsis composta]
MSGTTDRAHLVRLSIRRGRIETRGSFTDPMELFGSVMMIGIFLVVLFFQRGGEVEGTGVDTAAASLPGVIGMMVVFTGVLSTAAALSLDREDGTLLRAKALPGGMAVYLGGKIVFMVVLIGATVLLLLVPGMLLYDGTAAGVARGWPVLLGVLLLGIAATVPLGAALGSLFENPRLVNGVGMFPVMGLTAISGVFYPVTALPEWVQAIAQVFPIYWMALGMRAALLPDAMLAVEVGESWRTLETVGVLGAWTVLGMVLAPVLLRRMARRVSGAKVEAARQKAMQRV